ncbi:MAG: tetratricopeptide repeat protein [Bryobacteraceae bacterium]
MIRDLQQSFVLAEDEVRAEAEKPDSIADVDSLVARLEALETGASSVLLYAAPLAEQEFEGLCGRLNLYREKLAGMRRPLIFWIPSGLLALFTRSVPDFDSWVMLRLDLTEIVRPAGPAPEMMWSSEERLRPAEACRIAERLSGQARAAVPREEALVAAGGAVSALMAAGLVVEARALAEALLGVLATAEPVTATGMEAQLALREAEGRWTRQERVAAFGRWVARLDAAADSIDAIRARRTLAQAQFDAGDLEAARRVQEEVLATSRQLLGPAHPETLTGMNNLAMTLYAQGDLAGARRIQEQVVDTRRHLLGDEHPATLTSMNNLALTLSAQGDLPGSREIQERVLSLRRRLLGEEHPDTLGSMLNVAGTLYGEGDLAGARQIQERAVAVSRRALGEEHPVTLRSMNNLAATLGAQRDLTGARDIQEQVLDAGRRRLGKEHPDTVAAAWNLLTTLQALQDRPSANRLFRDALAPLLQRDSAALPADLRRIQQQLRAMVDTGKSNGEADPKLDLMNYPKRG